MKRWSTLLPTNRSRRTAASLCPLFSHLMWRHVPVWASMQGSNAQFEMGPPCNGQSTRCAERDDTAHTGSDNSPSRKGRGFYGITPMLCCPTASTLVAFNTAEGAYAAAASRTSTTSKYARAFPVGTMDHGTGKHYCVGKVPTDSIAEMVLACGRGGHSSPCLKAGG
jgi:hypothetical protein